MTNEIDLSFLYETKPLLKERELIDCLRILQTLAKDPSPYQETVRYRALLQAAQHLLQVHERHQDPKESEETTSEETQEAPEETLSREASFGLRLAQRRRCYSCKRVMQERHPAYDAFCVPCGDLNLEKRHQTTDLTGRNALITGGRSKIGYATSLKMLRAGARVLVTTRFPKHAAERFAKEADFAQWRERLIIHGLDLRSFPAIEAFTQEVKQLFGHLDILINNAAQTIRRPPLYYQPLIEAEAHDFSSPDLAQLFSPSTQRQYEACRVAPPPFLHASAAFETSPTTTETRHPEQSIAPWSPPMGITSLADIPKAWRQHASFLSGVPFLPEDWEARPQDFPAETYNRYGEYADMRDLTSWEMEIEQVHPFELFEVHMINTMAPFLLMRDLRPLMLRSPHSQRFLVNVTSTEGQFSDLKDPSRSTNKSSRHPHTNMTKAALNMLTLSGAATDAKRGIYRTAVDPGWASIENALPIRERWFAMGIDAPLTLEDAAARVCDPIFSPLLHQTEPPYGVLLKDYRVTQW